MDTKLTLIRSNIGSAMDLEILHLNKLYARYYKVDKVEPDQDGNQNGCPYMTTRVRENFDIEIP